METAVDMTARSESDSPNLPPNHHEKKNTAVTMMIPWRIAPPAAVTITLKLMPAPNSTRPIFRNSSVRKPGLTKS